jgi:poly(hydroxyalkanoate) depolymerase family esterase
MNPLFQRLMKSASDLTRQGDLRGATAAIQAALAKVRQPEPAGASNDAVDVIDVEARERPTPEAPPKAQPDAPAEGRFIAGQFAGKVGGGRAYKLYIPPQAAQHQPLPLVVMLHGCTQDPDDFAAGTRMNEAAQARGFYVLYPAQSAHANPQRCWNWFKHSNQQRGRGEPALLAGMTQSICAQHAIDPARVFVAGLSAGGAMAAILGETYPDLYAAVGVHSGLAAGAGNDLSSALAAMKGGAPGHATEPSGVPTIVFHGDADVTVHPGNGQHVVHAAAGTGPAQSTEAGERNGRRYSRQLYRTAGGTTVEQWVIHGSPHAWSGGSAAGSHTDRQGPDATEEMLRFFWDSRAGPR